MSTITSSVRSITSSHGGQLHVVDQRGEDPAFVLLRGARMQNHGNYAHVNGLAMYYEIHGAGEPLMVLPGAYMTVDLFGDLVPALAKSRRVIAVEFQGHGHTADIDRPFSYEQFADDSAALLSDIGIEQADVYGYSLGGGVALQLGLRHPSRVRKLVLASASYSSDGMYPEVLAGIENITPELFDGTPWREAYERTAPDSAAFPTLVEKLKKLDVMPFDWPIDELAAPSLILIGDADGTRLEHAVDMFRRLGGGIFGDLAPELPASQLAILPGTTHVGMLERAEWIVPMVTAFLATQSGDERVAERRDEEDQRMKTPAIVSPEEWHTARERLLAKEKEHTRARDALAAERRRMPWMSVDKEYWFEGPAGRVSLADIFEGRRQLILYRAFYGPEVTTYAEGGAYPERACVGCSLVADQIAHPAHLNARNTTLAFASRAPQPDIERLKQRHGLEYIPWYTITDDFDKDFDVDEWHGTNAFIRDNGRILRTYFINARGDEQMGSTWNYLDITALGRQEDWEDSPEGYPQTPPYQWWNYHDAYDKATSTG